MSYYGGDGLNKALVSVDEFMAVVQAVRGKPESAPAETIGQQVKRGAGSPAVAAGGAGVVAVALDAVPAASGLLGNLVPAAQIIAVVICAAFVGYMIWKQAR